MRGAQVVIAWCFVPLLDGLPRVVLLPCDQGFQLGVLVAELLQALGDLRQPSGTVAPRRKADMGGGRFRRRRARQCAEAEAAVGRYPGLERLPVGVAAGNALEHLRDNLRRHAGSSTAGGLEPNRRASRPARGAGVPQCRAAACRPHPISVIPRLGKAAPARRYGSWSSIAST